MKKTSQRAAPARSHHASMRHQGKAGDLESVRSEVQRLEQQRIDYETRARHVKDSLYGTTAAREPGRGWMDTPK